MPLSSETGTSGGIPLHAANVQHRVRESPAVLLLELEIPPRLDGAGNFVRGEVVVPLASDGAVPFEREGQNHVVIAFILLIVASPLAAEVLQRTQVLTTLVVAFLSRLTPPQRTD